MLGKKENEALKVWHIGVRSRHLTRNITENHPIICISKDPNINIHKAHRKHLQRGGRMIIFYLPPHLQYGATGFLLVHRTSAARQLPAMHWIHFCQSLLEYGKHMESHKRSLSCCALPILHSTHNGCVSSRDETVTHFTVSKIYVAVISLSIFKLTLQKFEQFCCTFFLYLLYI